MTRELKQLIDAVRKERDKDAIMELVRMGFTRRSLWRWIKHFPFARDEYESVMNFASFIAVTKSADMYEEATICFEALVDSEVHKALYDIAAEGGSIYPIRIPRHEIPNVAAFGRELNKVHTIIVSNGEIDYCGHRDEVLAKIAKNLSTDGVQVTIERVEDLEHWYRLSHHRESLYGGGDDLSFTPDVDRALGSQDMVVSPAYNAELHVDMDNALDKLTSLERDVILLKGHGYTKGEMAEMLAVKYPGLNETKVDRALRRARKKLIGLKEWLD